MQDGVAKRQGAFYPPSTDQAGSSWQRVSPRRTYLSSPTIVSSLRSTTVLGFEENHRNPAYARQLVGEHLARAYITLGAQ